VGRAGGSALGGQDGNSWSGSHLEGLMTLSWVVGGEIVDEVRRLKSSGTILRNPVWAGV